MTGRRSVVPGLLGLLVLVGCTAAPNPSGLTDEQERFVADAAAADERVTADPQVAIRLADRICTDLATGADPEDVVTDAQRFTGGETHLSREAAVDVVEAAQRTLCAG